MGSMRISLSAAGLLIKGPARLEVADGRVEIFGAPMARGDSAVLPGARSYPVVAEGEAVLTITLGHGGSVVNYDPDELIPPSWRETAERLSEPGTYMVVGDVNTGKSGFTLYWANKLAGRGLRVAIVDSDVGQSDIGPPGTIGVGMLEAPAPVYQRIGLVDAYFVGDTTPVGHLLPMVIGARAMVRRALDMGADVVLVNTTGMVYGGVGVALKWYKAEALNPKAIVYLRRGGGDTLLGRVLSRRHRVVWLETPRAVNAKEAGERRDFRELKYAAHMVNARTISLDLSKIRLLNTLVDDCCEDVKDALGKLDVPVCKVACDKLSVTIAINGKPRHIPAIDALRESYREVRVIFSERLRGLLVGLHSPDMRFLGIGRIEDIDFCGNWVKIRCGVEAGDVAYVSLGYVLLSEDGREVGRLRPGQI